MIYKSLFFSILDLEIFSTKIKGIFIFEKGGGGNQGKKKFVFIFQKKK